MASQRIGQLFGQELAVPAVDHPVLAREFLKRPLGLTLVEKVACLLGDPFEGKASTFRQDRLLQLLRSTWLRGGRELLDRLATTGELAALFAESRPTLHCDPPLTAAEVLRVLAILPVQAITERMDAARSLLTRCGKLEAYFLAKLLMSRCGLGADFSDETLAAALAECRAVDPGQVLQAISLTDPFEVARVLEQSGPAGLQAIRLRPLAPVRPALASHGGERITSFPAWVERKYDGIRFMLHKATDSKGAVQTAAFTRNRNDWLDRVPGLATTIQMLPGRSFILDGELFGFLQDERGCRPADVADVMRALHGDALPLEFRYVAFDLLFLDGADLTKLPFAERRRHLQHLVAAAGLLPLPTPVSLAEGQMIHSQADATGSSGTSSRRAMRGSW